MANFLRVANTVKANLNGKYHDGEFDDPVNHDPPHGLLDGVGQLTESLDKGRSVEGGVFPITPQKQTFTELAFSLNQIIFQWELLSLVPV